MAACASDGSPGTAVDAAVADAAVPLPDAAVDAPSLIATGTFSADIDAHAWTATTSTAIFTDGTVAISGHDGAGTIIGIGVEATQPGTYSVGASESTNFTLTDQDGTFLALLTQGSGSVTIVTLEAHRVTGTFLFTAIEVDGTGQRVVMNGLFDLAF